MNSLFMRFLLACSVLATSNGWSNPYDEILSELINPDDSGVAIIVTKNGNPIFAGARGSANLEQIVSCHKRLCFQSWFDYKAVHCCSDSASRRTG